MRLWQYYETGTRNPPSSTICLCPEVEAYKPRTSRTGSLLTRAFRLRGSRPIPGSCAIRGRSWQHKKNLTTHLGGVAKIRCPASISNKRRFAGALAARTSVGGHVHRTSSEVRVQEFGDGVAKISSSALGASRKLTGKFQTASPRLGG